MKNNKIVFWIVIVTVSLILIDQTSKFVIKYNYTEPIGNEIINITLIENSGIAFGLNDGNTKNIILTIIILMIIINFIKNQKDQLDDKSAVIISMILAGRN